jgi:hypothetical protein
LRRAAFIKLTLNSPQVSLALAPSTSAPALLARGLIEIKGIRSFAGYKKTERVSGNDKPSGNSENGSIRRKCARRFRLHTNSN